MKMSDDLITGISIIDEQHEKLFSLISQIDKFSASKYSFLEVLIELQSYVSAHFETEEEYMRYMNYPDSVAHKNCHDEFIKEYKQIMSTVSEHESIENLGPKLAKMLEEWFKNHYSNEDVKLAEYIRTH